LANRDTPEPDVVMKICIVSPNLPLYFRRDGAAQFGGAEAQAAFLAGALASAGHEVSLIVSDLRPDDSIPYPAHNAYRTDAGIPGFRFFHPRLPGAWRALETAGADVYYQRNASMLTGVAALFCRQHGRVFVYGAGSNVDFSFRRANLGNIRDRVMFRMGLKLAHGVVVQNHVQKDHYLRSHGNPVRIIANGIDLAEPVATGSKDLILWIGAIRSVKRPQRFLELAARMPQRKFVLLGGNAVGEESFSKSIVNEAESIPNLTMPGHVSHEVALDYLSRAGVLVNTSVVEGFPNAFLEAWNVGVPVFTLHDVDGLVGKEGVGEVCDDIDHMESAIRSALDDPDRMGLMRRKARELVEKRFSANALSGQYIDFFQDLLERRKKTKHRA
jgi:glycosyltransferase involved in cell wall biosynthesis